LSVQVAARHAGRVAIRTTRYMREWGTTELKGVPGEWELYAVEG
jgi:hypothetical protein